MQIYRTKLLSETESVANFFVPLLEALESYLASVLKMNNNSSDEYERKDNVTDDNDGDECLTRMELILYRNICTQIQEYLWVAFGQVRFPLFQRRRPDAFNSNKAM